MENKLLKIKNNKYIILLIILLIISFGFFIICPLTYNYYFNLFCGVIYFIAFIFLSKGLNKKNYLDFDTIFLISSFFVCFFYPIFLFPIDPTRYWAFQYSFDYNYINKGSSLCLLGYVSYMLARLTTKTNQKKSENLIQKIISTQPLSLITLVCLILFIIFGGINTFLELYGNSDTAGSGIIYYLILIIDTTILIQISIWLYNSYQISKKKLIIKCFPKLPIIIILSYLFILIITGSRTALISIVLLFLGLYTALYKPLNLKKFLFLVLIGIFALFLIGLFRMRQDLEINNFSDILMDLIISNRNIYTALNIVDEDGYSYGYSMLSYIFAPIPYLQNFAYQLFGIEPNETRSAMILTYKTLGNFNVGTGSNIISDIYLAFGPIGVIVLMFLFGRFIGIISNKFKKNIYYFTIYGIMTGYSVYMARAELFFCFRLIIWSLILLNVIKLHYKKLCFKI